MITRTRVLLSSLSLSLLLGCGGAQHSSGGSNTARGSSRPIERGRDGLPVDEHDMNDRVETWSRHAVHLLRADTRCVSNAMDVYLAPTPVRWARSVRVRMHSPRRISFHIEVRPTDPRGSYLGATMFGMETAEHEAILREQTACIAHTASGAPSSAPPAAVVVSSAPPSRTTPARTATRRAPRAPAVRVTASVAPPAVEVALPTVTAEAPLRGFVDLGDIAFNPLGDRSTYGKEFVLERTYAEVPMNDVHRSWVINRENIESALVLRIWTQEPIDFDGVVIQVEDLLLEPHIPEAEYERLMARRVATAAQLQTEFTTLCREHPENSRCYFTPENQRRYVGAQRPPPPPRDETRPTRPSGDHVWIGGGWQWNGSDYVWIAGMWRYVPPAIIATAAGSTAVTTSPTPLVAANTTATVAAPSASATANNPPRTTSSNSATTTTAPSAAATATVTPTATTTATAPTVTATFSAPEAAVIMPASAPVAPPPRTEVIPPAPQAGAMWIAGYWQWDGRAWAWNSGHWQMPPRADVRWTPPVVQVGNGGVQVFMAGGWLRLGP